MSDETKIEQFDHAWKNVLGAVNLPSGECHKTYFQINRDIDAGGQNQYFAMTNPFSRFEPVGKEGTQMKI